jgi:hypothetical protein
MKSSTVLPCPEPDGVTMIPALLAGESTVAVVLATDCVLAVFENAVAVTELPDTTARTAAMAADAWALATVVTVAARDLSTLRKLVTVVVDPVHVWQDSEEQVSHT